MIFWWKYKSVYSAVLTRTSVLASQNFSGTLVFLENGFGKRMLKFNGLDYHRPTQLQFMHTHPWYLAFAEPWALGTLTLDDVRNGRSDDMHLFPEGKVSRVFYK